jgi:hypothetical protein
MTGASFDFETYLESLCPGELFTLSLLTGGLVNVTSRATRVSTVLDTCLPSLRNESSFILKYAPPYIAALGESAPFSQFRQVLPLNQKLTADNRSQSFRIIYTNTSI